MMFVGTRHTEEQKELNTCERKDQNATKITSAFADSCIQFHWPVMSNLFFATTIHISTMHVLRMHVTETEETQDCVLLCTLCLVENLLLPVETTSLNAQNS